MSKPNTRRLDQAIRETNRKLDAVRKGELWPLTGSERRQMLAALAGGSYRVLRGKSTGRADNRIDSVSTSAETRLIAEITALQVERQRLVTEAAQAKAAKKSSGWW
ncbi:MULTISPECIES: hypothetical protein [unclassified Streptomyces]|uniref:hypothetical protein n=1 Tax=unclassified Streptomyces TaxID=2593676 RepID=UPI00225B2C73|nr:MULTISPECIES: hypothetical protein [unclassified Streptomyces]MCX4989904.1 hypothetical protein [Streptomyces sp. NBC_00568]MCX5004873.1 hypothetical protein [Streptomyces sp. NBC_00638]